MASSNEIIIRPARWYYWLYNPFVALWLAVLAACSPLPFLMLAKVAIFYPDLPGNEPIPWATWEPPVFLAAGCVLLISSFWKINSWMPSQLDRLSLRLTRKTLFLGRKDRIEIELNDISDVYFVARKRRYIFWRYYASVYRNGFDVMALISKAGDLVPVVIPPELAAVSPNLTDTMPITAVSGTLDLDDEMRKALPRSYFKAKLPGFSGAFRDSLIVLLRDRLRDGQPLPTAILPYLSPGQHNRRYANVVS